MRGERRGSPFLAKGKKSEIVQQRGNRRHLKREKNYNMEKRDVKNDFIRRGAKGGEQKVRVEREEKKQITSPNKNRASPKTQSHRRRTFRKGGKRV